MTLDNIPSLDELPLFASTQPTDLPAARHRWHKNTQTPPRGIPAVMPAATTGAADAEFWRLVNALRQKVAELQAGALVGQRLDRASREELGRAHIQSVVREHSDTLLEHGQPGFEPRFEAQLVKALFDAMFRLGRLQPLVERDGVVNIEITGHDRVLLLFADGHREWAPPIADSNADLINYLQFLASRDPDDTELSFTRANPHLEMRLPGRVRLAATAWTTPVPRVTIRLQHLKHVDLAMLRHTGEIDHVLEHFLTAAVRARKSLVVSGQGQGSGKALALDTPVPTPTGWTTMGQLRDGDQVFDETGTPCTVLATHPVEVDHDCYRVTFDDGTSIVADADHLWKVTRRTHRKAARRRKAPRHTVEQAERDRLWAIADAAAAEIDAQITIAEATALCGARHRATLYRLARHLSPEGHVEVPTGRAGRRLARTYSKQRLTKELAVWRDTPVRTVPRTLPEWEILTTRQLAQSAMWASGHAPWRTHDFAIPLAQPVRYSRTEQPIDPYVLGVWLGDGAASTARISTADPEVLSEFEAAGYPCRKVAGDNYDYGVGGGLQRQLRAAGLLDNKHIPATYLHGDLEQRQALLQGLMDSDGYCTRNGAAEFYTINERLADQVFVLAASLGLKPRKRSKTAVLNGAPQGLCWTVAWTTSTPVFRLPRKLDRQSLNHGGPTTRHITAVEPVPSVPVRCITVDSPSSLYLVSEAYIATHNTTLLRALAAALDPWESLATIETDFELYLHEEPERHHRVVPFETRLGSGEYTAAGTRAGEISASELLRGSLRHNVDRILVGEVRGAEIVAMFEAMQGGNGSMSTVHADSARDVIERLVGLTVKDSRLSETYAYRAIANSIDLIVYISVDTKPDGSRDRYVSQVIEVTRGERENPVAITDVFVPGPDGRAVPANAPTFIDDLVAAGFDRSLFNHTAGTWGQP